MWNALGSMKSIIGGRKLIVMRHIGSDGVQPIEPVLLLKKIGLGEKWSRTLLDILFLYPSLALVLYELLYLLRIQDTF